MMKTILAIFLSGILLETAFCEPPDPILASPMKRISLSQVYISDVLEYFRKKGTEELRRQTGDSTAILKFDYDFDPWKKRPIVNYDKKDTIFGEALRDVLDQQDLFVEVTAFDRMRITDAKQK